MRVVPLGFVAPSAVLTRPWMRSHTSYPVAIPVEGGIRVLFVCRDAQGRGHVAWCELDPADPTRVRDVCAEPILSPGEDGAFDDSGISIGNVAVVSGQTLLYYMGWNRSVTVPFRNAIGAAIAEETTGTPMRRVSAGPLLDRSRHDPYSLSYPFVSGTEGNWRMLYGTHRGSGKSEATMRHTITEATSADGIDWIASGRDLLAPGPGESALSRPWLTDHHGQSYMFFTAYTAEGCRIGCARKDGGGWTRLSNDCVPRSTDTWADAEVCYASTTEVNGDLLMFYCGNGYGRTGFGISRLVFEAGDAVAPTEM